MTADHDVRLTIGRLGDRREGFPKFFLKSTVLTGLGRRERVRVTSRHDLCLIPLSSTPGARGGVIPAVVLHGWSKFPRESGRKRLRMKNRRNTLLWMKDLIEHMTQCHEQLQWAGDGGSESFLAESLMVDLVECQRLCEELRRDPGRSRQLVPSV